MKKIILLFILLFLSQFCYAQSKGLPITAVSTDSPNTMAIIVDRNSIDAGSVWIYIKNNNPETRDNTEYFDYKDGQVLQAIHIVGEQKNPYSDQELQRVTPQILDYVKRGKGQFKGQSLYIAADFGKLDDVKKFVEEGADVNYVCEQQCAGWTPVMIAAANNHPEVVRYLISKGADVNIANRMGRTALHYSTNYEFIDIIKMLLEAGANPNATSQDNTTPNTPVKAAILRENTTILKLLLQAGGDKNAEYDGVSLLNLAEKKKDEELKALLTQ